jgi:putative transposase
MPSRAVPFANGGFYHIFNRGVDKQNIFRSDRDYQRFLETLYYYQFEGPKPRFSTHKRFKIKDYANNPKIVEVMCYCLMPNHFHLLLTQIKDVGLVEYLSKISNSYTKYFNTKHSRSGPLFSGEFKSVFVDSEEQLLHLSRYIHLNPYVNDLTADPESYLYSSYSDYIGLINGNLCNKNQILSSFSDPQGYQKFVKDYEAYTRDVAQLRHLAIDSE